MKKFLVPDNLKKEIERRFSEDSDKDIWTAKLYLKEMDLFSGETTRCVKPYRTLKEAEECAMVYNGKAEVCRMNALNYPVMVYDKGDLVSYDCVAPYCREIPEIKKYMIENN